MEVEANNQNKQIESFWYEYTMGKTEKNTILRPEIFASWMRCREWGLDPYMQRTLVFLDETELQEVRRRKSDLLEVAIPVIHDIYSIVEGTGFGVWLADENGIILETMSDQVVLEKCLSSGFIPGG